MRERIWASLFTSKETIGGAEIMGDQYSESMNLKQFSCRKLGIPFGGLWDTTAKMDDFLRRVDDIEILVRNSKIGYTFKEKGRPRTDIDVAVCCENFFEEAKSLYGTKEWSAKMDDYQHQKVSLEMADKIVVPSDYEKVKFIEQGFPEDKITVIEPYVDYSEPDEGECLDFKEGLGYNRDEHLVLFVGRKHKRKGYDTFYEATKRFPDTKFLAVLAGTDIDKEEGNLRAIGNVSREDMGKIYGMSDIFFFPTRYEGFGIVSAEALCQGLTVVSYGTGLFWDDSFDDYSYIVHGEYDMEALIENLGTALKMIPQKKNPAPIARNRFSKETFDKKCAELIK